MALNLVQKIFGDPNEKALKKLWPLVNKINSIVEDYQKNLSPENIPTKTSEFKERVAKGESLDDLLPEAFALVKFTCMNLLGKKWPVRGHDITWDMVPYDVQLLGGIVMHQGKIAEMKTGEGKTLVCTLPVYLNALAGKGVHVVTVNDYLAHRDAEWMGGLYRALGLEIGIISYGQDFEEKKAAYSADITYGTNNEFGFDYLRDNMSSSLDRIVQRDLFYAIVDEVDSILIDEARTPLIISSPAEESTSKYIRYAQLVSDLKENEDYVIDEKMKTATLTEEGIVKMEKKMGVDNIYTDAGFNEVHHLEQSLKALTVYKRDIDYVVNEGEILIVDEFTGRLMPGRRYSDGLHQAIEAKEGVEVKRESKTLATITFQNYFRIYKKLAGMTGTAMTEAEEFLQIYGLDPIAIPTNKAIVRADQPDMVFKNQKGKYMAVVKRVKEAYEKGQPVLIGTISIEKSELMSKLLEYEKIPHQVLNAKHHEREAEIVAKAGQKGAVTIATNMAGRGTDIKLGECVAEVGGLLVIGTERHESRRIDNQLRGRSGRQGDPGESQFFISMEDDLMRLFGPASDRIRITMEHLKIPDDMHIQNKSFSNKIETAQKAVEGRNFDIRKHIVQYDDVMNKHREIIYSRRRKVLTSENIKNDILLMIEKEVEKLVKAVTPQKGEETNWNYPKLYDDIKALYENPDNPLRVEEIEKYPSTEDLIEAIVSHLQHEYLKREELVRDPEIMRQVERNIYLNVIDTLWMAHIDAMQNLRESVSLRGYGQRDPLIEYKEEAYIMFVQLLDEIQNNTLNTLFKMEIAQELPEHLLKIQTEPQRMITNDAQIEAVLQGSTPSYSTINSQNEGSPVIATKPAVIKVSADSPIVSPTSQIGRNDLCPCGSGKKYKKCHGAQ